MVNYMYIEISTLCYGILAILAAVALIYLILCLNKLNSLLKQISIFWSDNHTSISSSVKAMPKAADNVVEISENLKVVSEVITETTATAIETKEDISVYFETIKDILNIIKKVWLK